MAYPQNRMGCLGLIAIAMFLLTFSYLFTYERRAEAEKLAQEERAAELARKAKHSEGAIGPEFTTMDAQLSQAKEEKRKVTQVHLEGASAPLDGSWDVKEVGYDVVLLDGAGGALTLRTEQIVGVRTAPISTTIEHKPSGDLTPSEFSLMKEKLTQAKRDNLEVLLLWPQGISEPIEGPWSVKEITDETVSMDGPKGWILIRIEKILGIKFGQPTNVQDQQVEKH